MKKLSVRLFLLVLTLSTVAAVTCNKGQRAVGRSRDVVVVSSVVDTHMVSENLQIYYYVPQREKLFNFFYASDTNMASYDKFHSIFIYGSLEDEFINDLLSPDAQQATMSDSFVLFKLDDLWAREQLVTILATAKPQYIRMGIEKYSGLVKEILEENYYVHVRNNFYERPLDKNTMHALAAYGFTLDLGKGWLIDSTFGNEGFIFVHVHFPDRSVFVFKDTSSLMLDEETALTLRDNLTHKHYNGDYVLKEFTSSQIIEFKGMKGLRVRGVWQNDSLVAGGPFLSYFLKREDTLLILDGMLFNPGERKTDYLTSLEVILNSYGETMESDE